MNRCGEVDWSVEEERHALVRWGIGEGEGGEAFGFHKYETC